MGKKDFIALADALRPILLTPEEVIDALCRWMQTMNPRFKDQLWRDYLAGKCGPSGGRLRPSHFVPESEGEMPDCSDATSEELAETIKRLLF